MRGVSLFLTNFFVQIRGGAPFSPKVFARGVSYWGQWVMAGWMLCNGDVYFADILSYNDLFIVIESWECLYRGVILE